MGLKVLPCHPFELIMEKLNDNQFILLSLFYFKNSIIPLNTQKLINYLIISTFLYFTLKFDNQLPKSLILRLRIIMENNQNIIINYISPTQFLYEQLRLTLKTAAPLKKWKRFADRSKDRYNRFKELVTTEGDYLNDLIKLKTQVKGQLERAKLITTQQGNEMFPNIDGMINLSEQIFSELKSVLQNWNRNTTMIGNIMLKYSRFLMIYADYFKNMESTLQKLKRILSTKEQARMIEKQLYLPNRIITFQDLVSKPFQRPLKYHLILRDYCSKTEITHPDYPHLKAAIECYHKVNQQNNLSVENKQKNQTLMSLQSKFGNIIKTEARYYITQYDAVCLQTPIIIYLFSDIAILVYKKPADRQFMRISFNKYSHVQMIGDVQLFKNRLYFYGQTICVHLTFADKSLRDDVYHSLRKLIEQISQNEAIRETIIIQRLSRNSRSTLKRKFSFTNLQPQILRPIIAKIVGLQTRVNQFGQQINYFVIKFTPSRPNLNTSYSPHHISLISQEQILRLQKFVYSLYPDELICMPLSTVLRSLVNDIEYRKAEARRIEIKTIMLQLFLNSVFRNNIILKRIDIIMHFLHISDPIWNFLKINNQICLCQACLKRPQFTRYDDYLKQILDRSYHKINLSGPIKRTEFCETRTIHSQMNFSSMYPQLMHKAKTQDKIAWCKCKLGWINQTLTNTKPQSKFVQPLTVKIFFRGISNILEYDIQCYPNDRIKKILNILGGRSQMNLEDYTLIADVNKQCYVLGDDEPIGNVITKIQQQQGFFSKVSSIFHKKQEFVVSLYLQKYWVIFSMNDYIVCDKSRRIKVNREVQSIMSRLYYQEMRVGQEEVLQFYALYLSKRYFGQIKYFNPQRVATKIRNRAEIYFPVRMHNESNIFRIYQKIDRIRNDHTLKSDYDIAIRILQKASQKPGWSCIMFDALREMVNSEPIQVKIGCDLRGVRVRQLKKLSYSLQFRLEDDNWHYHTNGKMFMITDNQKTYRFSGREIWKIEQQIQFYTLYTKSFGLK